MTDSASDQVTCGSLPCTADDPREPDEREWKIWCGYRKDAKECYRRGWVSSGPYIDGNKGERGRKKGKVDEGGKALRSW